MGSLDVIVGGQFGSESKGHLTADLAKRYIEQGKHVVAVRVAGHNAGHTAYDAEGREWALRTIPAAAVVDERIALVIAAGSEVDHRVLLEEIHRLEAAGIPIRSRLFIDPSATWLQQVHIEHEQQAQMHEKSGSTAKGVGAARAERIMRTAKTIGDWIKENPQHFDDSTFDGPLFVVANTGPMLRDLVQRADHAVLIEGTQGYGLGVHTEHYPLTTSSDCRAIDFLAMAGIDPTAADEYRVWVTVRPFPIRVAGPSGALKGETTFEALGQPDEFTTVTKKKRRVGEWDGDLVKAAIEANGGPRVVRIGFSMVDKVFSKIAGATEYAHPGFNEDVADWLDTKEQEMGAEIGWFGTGPNSAIFREDAAAAQKTLFEEKMLAGLNRLFGAVKEVKIIDLGDVTEGFVGNLQSGRLTSECTLDCACRTDVSEIEEADEDERIALAAEMSEFWERNTRRHIDMTVPKVVEYGGAHDLLAIGRELREFAGFDGDDLDDEQANYEAGVYFYVRGKVARWMSAIDRGDAVSTDTLDDIIIYSTMVQHQRAERGVL